MALSDHNESKARVLEIQKRLRPKKLMAEFAYNMGERDPHVLAAIGDVAARTVINTWLEDFQNRFEERMLRTRLQLSTIDITEDEIKQHRKTTDNLARLVDKFTAEIKGLSKIESLMVETIEILRDKADVSSEDFTKALCAIKNVVEVSKRRQSLTTSLIATHKEWKASSNVDDFRKTQAKYSETRTTTQARIEAVNDFRESKGIPGDRPLSTSEKGVIASRERSSKVRQDRQDTIDVLAMIEGEDDK